MCKIGLLILLLTASFPAGADVPLTGNIRCKAKAPISPTWNVYLKADSGEIEIQSSNGTLYRGKANYKYLPQRLEHAFFLPLDFSEGLSMRVDERPNRQIALCFKADECYLCRE